jgi:hypothetical protein
MAVRAHVVGVLLALVLSAGSLSAQSIDPTPLPDNGLEQSSPGRSYLLGAALGAAGFAAGGLVGFSLDLTDCTNQDYCGFDGLFIGGAIAGTLGLAWGVHLGNDRRGSLPLDMLTAAAIWGVGMGGAALSGWEEPYTLIAAIGVPIAQLFATVAVERVTGRSRSEQRSVSVYAAPNLQGGATLSASVRF